MGEYSSFFHVRRACGHVEQLPQLLPPAVEESYTDHADLLAAREQALIAEEARVCINCYSRDDSGTLVAELRRLGLSLSEVPTLIGGTVRQTRLARLLRSRKMAEIRDQYAQYQSELDQRVHAEKLSSGAAAAERAWCERAITAVLATTSPDWWIAQQNCSGWELVRRAARHVPAPPPPAAPSPPRRRQP